VFSWYFADEANRYADSIAESLSSARAVVPTIWPLEVANTLLMGERCKRSTEPQTTAFLSRLGQLPITIDHQTTAAAWSSTMRLARQHQLSAYDAAYLELALRLGAPLATLDEALKKSAKAAGVAVYASQRNRGV
jgi:predicted nucleic acid-binding protein